MQVNKVYMHELIDARTSGPNTEDSDDLLSRMISARETEKDSPYHFTDAKLTGRSTLASLIVCLQALARQRCGSYFSLWSHTHCIIVFTFAHAGHETSSGTLSFALGLLALHPDIQETFRQSILEVVPEGQIPVRRYHSPIAG